MNVAMIITGLSTGGAETMLLRLLENSDRDRFSFRVFSLTDLGETGQRILTLGVPVEAMGLRRGAPNVFVIAKLARRLRETNTALVHTWMYHADLLGGLAARLAGVRAIAWGIHNTNLDRDKTKLTTRLVVRLNALSSSWLPAGILSCSQAARDVHVSRGYEGTKITVIPNGFDLSRFKPDTNARHSVREELHLSAGTPLVGIVGRFDPLKNHAGFLEAAGLLLQTRPDVRFLLIGRGLEATNSTLAAVAQRTGAANAVRWLGHRNDVPRLMASLDVLASSSFGEAFPNVLGEAMACGVPCVVTDVGDSAAIVGDTGRVVQSCDMPALAAGIEDLLALEDSDRFALGRRARARIEEHYEIGGVTRRHEVYYLGLARNTADKIEE